MRDQSGSAGAVLLIALAAALMFAGVYVDRFMLTSVP